MKFKLIYVFSSFLIVQFWAASAQANWVVGFTSNIPQSTVIPTPVQNTPLGPYDRYTSTTVNTGYIQNGKPVQNWTGYKGWVGPKHTIELPTPRALANPYTTYSGPMGGRVLTLRTMEWSTLGKALQPTPPPIVIIPDPDPDPDPDPIPDPEPEPEL